jgi:hypothetical protein
VPRPTHQERQQTSFARPDIDSLSLASHFTTGAVENEIADLHVLRRDVGRTAEQRSDPCEELGMMEGFDEVVVGAAIKT